MVLFADKRTFSCPRVRFNSCSAGLNTEKFMSKFYIILSSAVNRQTDRHHTALQMEEILRVLLFKILWLNYLYVIIEMILNMSINKNCVWSETENAPKTLIMNY
jgi:hypothetical protein